MESVIEPTKVVFQKPADRLIVAADFKPNEGKGRHSVIDQVLNLANSLQGTDVYIKVNSALRACGYDLIGEIHQRGLRVFTDLKLCDIPETLSIDGLLLREASPELLTVMCSTGAAAMQALKEQLPNTELLGVTALTSLTEQDTYTMFSCSPENAVIKFARIAYGSGVNGLISSPKEVASLREIFGDRMTINTPGIRPNWASVAKDDQNPDRIMTPFKAIKAGADRIVIGRPITQANDPLEAVMRTLEEISEAMA